MVQPRPKLARDLVIGDAARYELREVVVEVARQLLAVCPDARREVFTGGPCRPHGGLDHLGVVAVEVLAEAQLLGGHVGRAARLLGEVALKLCLFDGPYLVLLDAYLKLDGLKLVQPVDGLADGHEVGVLRVLLGKVVHALHEQGVVFRADGLQQAAVLDHLVLAVLGVVGGYEAVELRRLAGVHLLKALAQGGLVLLKLRKELVSALAPVLVARLTHRCP